MKQAWVLEMITTIMAPFLCKALGRLLLALMGVIMKTSDFGGQAGSVSNAYCTRPGQHALCTMALYVALQLSCPGWLLCRKAC